MADRVMYHAHLPDPLCLLSISISPLLWPARQPVRWREGVRVAKNDGSQVAVVHLMVVRAGL